LLLLSVPLTSAAALPILSGGQPGVTMTQLELLPGHDSAEAYAINEHGHVAGYSARMGSFASSAVVWQDGHPTELGPGLGTAINSRGQVAITDFGLASGNPSAGRWSGGHIDPITPNLPGAAVFARDINEFGAVSAGTMPNVFSGTFQRIGVWRNGTLTDVTLPGFAGPDATGNTDGGFLNNLGQLAGSHRVSYDGAGFAFTCTGTSCATLPAPAGVSAVQYEVDGINDFGQVIGIALDSTHNQAVAVRWSGGQAVSLGTLGGANSGATAINDLGDIVGSADDAAGQSHAVLWRNGRIIDLGGLGGAFAQAMGLNNQGQIIGRADTPAHQTRPVMWTVR
jgi:probable HAF family extracellular repeat protein